MEGYSFWKFSLIISLITTPPWCLFSPFVLATVSTLGLLDEFSCFTRGCSSFSETQIQPQLNLTFLYRIFKLGNHCFQFQETLSGPLIISLQEFKSYSIQVSLHCPHWLHLCNRGLLQFSIMSASFASIWAEMFPGRGCDVSLPLHVTACWLSPPVHLSGSFLCTDSHGRDFSFCGYQ